jgi:hypothetical protein
LKTSVLSTKAKDVFKTVLAERPKLNEDKRLSKFVNSRFDKDFKPGEEAKLKDDLNKFVDSQVTEYQELFGEPKPDQKAKEKPAGKEKPDEEEAEGGESGADLEELKKSDLFPKD